MPASGSSLVVDFHTHAIAPSLPDLERYSYARWPRVSRTGDATAEISVAGRPFREIDDRCWRPERRLEDMRAEGVAVQVLSPIPVTLCYDAPAEGAAVLARAQNDFLADMVARRPDSFRALGTVPLQDVSLAVEELRRCVDELGFLGVEIGTTVGPRELAEASHAPFFEAAEELRALLFIHPTAVPGASRLDPYGLTFGVGMPTETATAAAMLISSGAFDRWPDLRVCLAHGGGALAQLLPRMDKGWELQSRSGQQRCRRAPSDYAPGIWVDSLTYDAATIEFLLARFGADRVVIGSDYPFAARESPAAGSVARARLDSETTRATYRGHGLLQRHRDPSLSNS
ncbi:amidohydrolase family protein [Nocardioides sp.]|uniref:amidohydrolase family protein n=1 Tax=Nocardioides sp. TaxID=35761 RepID=UPI0039E5B8AB